MDFFRTFSDFRVGYSHIIGKIRTEEKGKGKENPAIAARVRERSRMLAKTRAEVEADIEKRTSGAIETEEIKGYSPIDE